MTVERTDEKFTLRKMPYDLIRISLLFLAAIGMLISSTVEAMVNGRGADDLPGLLFSWAFMLAITFVYLRAVLVVTLTLDRTAGTATHRRANVFGATQREIPLADLFRVEVERGTDSDNDPTFRLILRLRDGEVIPFTQSTHTWLGDKQAATDAANQFLGVESPLVSTPA